MFNIAFAVYRQWAFDIFIHILEYQQLRKDFSVNVLLLPKEYEFKLPRHIKQKVNVYIIDPKNTPEINTILKKNNNSIVFWYGWSWIVKKPLLEDFISICLHPSLLPKYRGGTPIQHQILSNEKHTGITIFRMNEGIDAGPIYSQEYVSFSGNIDTVFQRLSDVGTVMTKQLITDAVNKQLLFTPQKNLDKYPPNKRRRPQDSEILFADLRIMTFIDLNNFVRSLLDPYPNLCLVLPKRRIFLQHIEHYTNLPVNSTVLNEQTALINGKKDVFIQLKNGYAKLIIYKMDLIQ